MNSNSKANAVAKATKDATAADVKARVWKSIAKNAVGGVDAERIFEEALTDLVEDVDQRQKQADVQANTKETLRAADFGTGEMF
ncbi:hypothetical protein GCM10007209_26940 [Haloferax sulfurifontis]|uniref:Uncharacterized protein n=1 Tax=Haloferax sulfurifontis TaxID=255616 RepID=A0A830EA56_9EURY|nr:hypothetical protein [Haloferax sp. BAB-2207]GGC63421.1 hypothetical protein GCM10007209_26940 [Haloferax sulfurifontis]